MATYMYKALISVDTETNVQYLGDIVGLGS